jgi:hypothetical protein
MGYIVAHKAKVIIFFIFLIFCLNCSKVDRIKFEDLYRAGKAFDGATTVGVNYERFGELLQNLATEISIAAEKAKSQNEKEMLKQYAIVLAMYRDSHLVWKYQIKTKRYKGIPPEAIIVKPEMEYVIKRYSLNAEKWVLQRRGWTVVEDIDMVIISGDSIQKIWAVADKLLEETTKKYFGYGY